MARNKIDENLWLIFDGVYEYILHIAISLKVSIIFCIWV